MLKVIDGIRLAYDDAGTGDAIVLLHGFPLDRTVWDDQFDALARCSRVIRIDLRGSGESGGGEGPALMETLAGDVFGLLEALGVERAVVAGHSMGGYVALAFFRMYAERVAGLALIASHVGADPPQRRADRDMLVAALHERGIAAVLETVPRIVSAASLARDPALRNRLDVTIGRQNAAGLAAQVVGMKERVGSEDLLEDIAVPALIVGGNADPLIPRSVHKHSAALIADCEFVAVTECGHAPMLEAPRPTTAALQRLMARCAQAATARQSARAVRV